MKINKRLISVVFFLALFIAGITAGYLYLSVKASQPSPHLPEKNIPAKGEKGDFLYLKIYYPISDGLEMEQRRAQGRTPTPRIVLSEFLKGPAGRPSYVPRNTQVLGIYNGSDGILYIDLSEDFRGNFQGDAMAEFLLLRAIYESMMSNISGIRDIKVLIEGKEVDSLAGHISLVYPLGESISQAKEAQK
ncbi:MAG: GerMN domain-containing protein [Nitrospirae bacterium]|nr:GerMN domain-containing protein [Nitrospirota bacterium]